MDRRSLLVAVVAAAAAHGCGKKKPAQTAEHAPVETAATALSVTPLAEGARVPLGEVIKGKVSVVDLWATWCEACREVSKNAELLAKAYGRDGLLVVGLSVGEARADVARYLEGKPHAYPIYLDPELHVADALDAKELPTIAVFDKAGRLVAKKRKIDAEIVRLVERLLIAS